MTVKIMLYDNKSQPSLDGFESNVGLEYRVRTHTSKINSPSP